MVGSVCTGQHPFARADCLLALSELLAAQGVFERKLIVVDASLDKKNVVWIRRVDNCARKQITELKLPVLPVEPRDVVNGFETRRSEFIGPQVRFENKGPGKSQPML